MIFLRGGGGDSLDAVVYIKRKTVDPGAQNSVCLDTQLNLPPSTLTV